MDKKHYRKCVMPLIYKLLTKLFGQSAKEKAGRLVFQYYRSVQTYYQSLNSQGVIAQAGVNFSGDHIGAHIFTQPGSSDWDNALLFISYSSIRYDRWRIGVLAPFKKEKGKFQIKLIWVDEDYLSQRSDLLSSVFIECLERDCELEKERPVLVSENYNNLLTEIYSQPSPA